MSYHAPQRSSPPLPAGSVTRLVSVGLLAGLAGGALAGMLFAAVLTTAARPTVPQPLASWLLQAGFAAILAGMMGAWAGAQTGIALGLLLIICRHRCGRLLFLAPLFGLAAGLLHGSLASIDQVPGIRPTGIAGNIASMLFYLAVQLSAALSASWWLDGSSWSSGTAASQPPLQLPQFGVCERSLDDDNQ